MVLRAPGQMPRVFILYPSGRHCLSTSAWRRAGTRKRRGSAAGSRCSDSVDVRGEILGSGRLPAIDSRQQRARMHPNKTRPKRANGCREAGTAAIPEL